MQTRPPGGAADTSPAAHPSRMTFGRMIRPLPLAVLAAVPVVFLALVIVGAVRWFSPVPFWDMWDGYIYPYTYLLDGDWRTFWFQEANEHRIVFSKLLFWVDLRFFGGESRFLIPSNVVLLTLDWLAFCAMARRLFPGRKDLWLIVCLGLAAPGLSWLQEANITWAYQSQFFVAYLFPLLAFACLAMSAEGPRAVGWFALAVIFGVGSLGTMANGLLAPPLMVVMMLLMKPPSAARIAVVVMLAGLCTALWFHNYVIVPRDHPTPGQFLIFVLTFLSGPFIRIFATNAVGYILSVVFIGANIAIAVRILRRRRETDPMILALLVFLAYIGGTCAVIGYGRAASTTNAAFAFRYATPALMAWSALGLLCAAAIKDRPGVEKIYLGVGLVFALVFLPSQWAVFRDSGRRTAEHRNLGGLALMMNVTDATALGYVYPADTPDQVAHLEGIAQLAKEKRLSIFADPAFTDAIARVGLPAGTDFYACRAGITGITPVSSSDDHERVVGWVYDKARHNRIPQLIYFAEDGLIVGLGISGAPRSDVAKIFGRRARYGGFEGYVIRGAASTLSVLCAGAPA